MWRKTIVATALVSAGFASTTGAAFAGESDHGGDPQTSSHEGHDGDQHGHKGHKGHDGDNAKGCSTGVDADNGDGATTQSGLANVNDVSTIIPANVCGNNVPVNVLGVQVPIQDGSLNLPILSGSGNRAGVDS